MEEKKEFRFDRDLEKIRQVQPREEDTYIRRTHRSRRGGFWQRETTKKTMALFLAAVIGCGAGLGAGYGIWGYERVSDVDLKEVKMPSWVEQDFIRKNIFSRPDVSIKQVNNIVIHYVANPGSSAKGNRNYFDSLADQDPEKGGVSSSSHFIVGLEGEILQCIPISEMAYANAPRNQDTIAIETCHPDESGQYNEATYESLVKLTAWLCRQLELDETDVIRHYDVNGKACPRDFVDHEDHWKQFRKDVKEAIKEGGKS